MNKNIDNLMVLDNKKFETKFIGRILWFSISEMKVSHTQLETAFNNAGLDNKYLPRPISPRDAFRRATKIAEEKRIKIDDEKYLNLMVREVKSSGDEMIRKLVREVVDSKNVRLEYLPVANMVLKNDKDFDAYRLPEVPYLYPEEKAALLKVGSEFDDCCNNYHARHVRDLVTNILFSCAPVALRPSGGVYYTPEEYAETVEALGNMIKEISQFGINGDNSSLWSLPVIDAEEQREMIEKSLEEQVKSDSQSLIAEMAKKLKEGTITQKAAEKYIEKVKELRNKVKKYEDMLETEVLSCQTNMELAMQQARKLLENVEAA